MKLQELNKIMSDSKTPFPFRLKLTPKGFTSLEAEMDETYKSDYWVAGTTGEEDCVRYTFGGKDCIITILQ